MDLQSLNPKVFAMWEVRRDLGSDYFAPSTEDDITEIEKLVGHRVPSDYREFLLKYSTVGAVPSVGANYFPLELKGKAAIAFDFSLIPWAKLTISAIDAFHNPHPTIDGVDARLPKEVLPLTSDNNATLLIDLREERFGNILYIRSVKKKTFGTSGYGWEQIGYVAPTFTDFLRELGTEEELKARYPGRKII